MDFESSLDSVDLSNYIDNSEWELLSIEFQKGVHTYACCPDPHPGKYRIIWSHSIVESQGFFSFFLVKCFLLPKQTSPEENWQTLQTPFFPKSWLIPSICFRLTGIHCVAYICFSFTVQKLKHQFFRSLFILRMYLFPRFDVHSAHTTTDVFLRFQHHRSLRDAFCAHSSDILAANNIR